jgi:hypothetical protein
MSKRMLVVEDQEDLGNGIVGAVCEEPHDRHLWA